MNKMKTKKLKVGILTFHSGFNHGAFMQAYCMQTYLISQGCDAFIINYINPWTHFKELLHFLVIRDLRRIPYNFLKILRFTYASVVHLKKYPLIPIFQKSLLTLISSRFDLILLGSDVIWDKSNSTHDDVFFGLNLRPSKFIFSYAPSIGAMNSTSKDDKFKFDNVLFISCRDHSTKKYILDSTSRNAQLVCDPTLLLNFKYKPHKPIHLPRKYHRKYILLYAYYIPQSICRLIKKFALENNFSIVCIGYYHSFSDVDKTDIGPFLWASYFQHASYVITSTYHGTIFSIINKVNFVTFVSSASQNKVNSLLSILNLQDRIINASNTDECIDVLNSNINWDSATRHLNQYRENSFSYLRSVLLEADK